MTKNAMLMTTVSAAMALKLAKIAPLVTLLRNLKEKLKNENSFNKKGKNQ